ncbi:MAG: sulfite exporter TauE/SafE family protein [Flavobacteriales bacterium]
MNVMLPAAFVLGIAGSAHCIGMCGPIALAVPSPAPGWRSRAISTVILNTGRLTTYGLLGAAIGTFGQGLRLAGLREGVSIVAGVLLLASVAAPAVLKRWNPSGRLTVALGALRGTLAHNLKRTAPEALFLTGALNGLLPCGLVYAALLGAVTLGGPAQGALFMVSFALGTWPALFALRMSGGLIGQRTRAKLRRASPVIVSALAVLLILRGLGVNMPMAGASPLTTPAHVTGCH